MNLLYSRCWLVADWLVGSRLYYTRLPTPDGVGRLVRGSQLVEELECNLVLFSLLMRARLPSKSLSVFAVERRSDKSSVGRRGLFGLPTRLVKFDRDTENSTNDVYDDSLLIVRMRESK